MTLILDWCGAILLLSGVFFTLVAGIGLVSMDDAWSRMHAASKPQLLGLLLVCLGIALSQRSAMWTCTALVVLAMQIITAPVGSHLIARAIDRTERRVDDAPDGKLVVDERASSLQGASLPETPGAWSSSTE